jgi:hypothetical protein
VARVEALKLRQRLGVEDPAARVEEAAGSSSPLACLCVSSDLFRAGAGEDAVGGVETKTRRRGVGGGGRGGWGEGGGGGAWAAAAQWVGAAAAAAQWVGRGRDEGIWRGRDLTKGSSYRGKRTNGAPQGGAPLECFFDSNGVPPGRCAISNLFLDSTGARKPSVSGVLCIAGRRVARSGTPSPHQGSRHPRPQSSASPNRESHIGWSKQYVSRTGID